MVKRGGRFWMVMVGGGGGLVVVAVGVEAMLLVPCLASGLRQPWR